MNPERFSEEGSILTEEVAEVAEPHKEESTEATRSSLDYDERIGILRDQIKDAEAKMDEKEVLALEDELRQLEKEKQVPLEQVEYETTRSAVANRFEEIKSQVQNQTELVKRFENTDEGKYTETLAELRRLEQERAEAGLFLSRYWGQSLEAHRNSEAQFKEAISSADNLDDLTHKVGLWGGIPQGESGKFLTASQFVREIEGASSPEEVEASLGKIGIEDSVVEKIVGQLRESQAVGKEIEATPLSDTERDAKTERMVDEYNKTFLEEKELREINDLVHSSVFQGGLSFKAWSLLPSSRRKLALLDKYGLDYSTSLARKSGATTGVAFRLREVAQKKRELKGLLLQAQGPEKRSEARQDTSIEETQDAEDLPLVEDSPALPSEVEVASAPEVVQESVQEEAEALEEETPSYKKAKRKSNEEILGELKGVGVEVLPKDAPIMTEGREMKRRLKGLTEEVKILGQVHKALQSKLFASAPKFYPHGKKLVIKLKELGIPFETEKERQEAETKIAELLEKASEELAVFTGTKN